MKKYLVNSLLLGAFLLVLIGMPLQSAYAHHHNDRTVPEPATLALLGSGIAGVGLYSVIKRKNRK